MIFICSFIILAVFFCVFMLLVAGGFIVFSNDVLTAIPEPQPSPVKLTKVKVKKQAFIDLNGRLIELQTATEIKSAKQDGYKVVYK